MIKYGSMVDRLTSQLAAKGVLLPRVEAIAYLKECGVLKADGSLTAKGIKRTSMGPAGRAKDRAARQTGHKPTDYVYSRKTNSVRLK